MTRMSQIAIASAADLLVGLLPPDRQEKARTLLARYGAAQTEFLAAQAAVQAELGSLLGLSPKTTVKAVAATKSRNDQRSVLKLSVSALRLYDVLVSLEADQQGITLADATQLLGHLAKPEYAADLSKAVIALTTAGLITVEGDRYRYVRGKTVPYSALYLPAAAAVRLFRVRQLTTDQITDFLRQGVGMSQLETNPARVRTALLTPAAKTFNYDKATQTWTPGPDFFDRDPPVDRLPDETATV